LEVPVIHGSRTIVNGLAADLKDEGKCCMGWKVRRNEASLLRCLTVKDIFKSLYDAVAEVGEGHNIIVGYRVLVWRRLILPFQVLGPSLV